MKVTYKELIEELLPAFKKLAAMQNQGGVMLHNTIADGINRNYRLLNQLMKPHQEKEINILKKHVLSESKMGAITFKTIGQGKDMDFDYMVTIDSEKNGELTGREHREAATKEIADLKDSTADWTPVKISEEEFAKVHNLPMDVYSAFSHFEIITSLPIVQPKLHSIGRG